MNSRIDAGKPSPKARIYHLLIFGSAAVVLALGAVWRGGVNDPPAESSEVTAIEILRKEVSGVQSALMRNELEVMRDAIIEVSTSVGPSVIAFKPRPEAQEPLRNVRIYGATGSVETRSDLPNPRGISGLVVDGQGHVMTSAEIAEYTTPIEAVVGAVTHLADVVSVDQVHHLALVKLREIPANIVPLNLNSVSDLKAGEWIVRLGRTPSGELARSPYFLESVRTTGTGEAMGILHDQGSLQISGASFVNASGRIVGIYLRPSSSSGFVMPIRRAIEFATRLKTARMREPLAWAGFQLQELSSDLKEYFADASGVLVSSVDPDSPAAKAGLRPGDVIETVDGNEAREPAAVMNSVAHSPANTRLFLGIKRNSRPQKIEMTLSDLPSPKLEQNSEQGSLVLQLGPVPTAGDGVTILSVRPQSTANKIGVMNGDVILSIDGRLVRSNNQFWLSQRNDSNAKPQLWSVRRGDMQFFVAVKERVMQP